MGNAVFIDNTVFGLDIGTRSVVGTVGYRKPTGEFVILSQKSECHETRAMLDGQIHDIPKVADTVLKVKKELEDELNITLNKVCIAAAGRVLKTINVRMDYDLGDEMVVTEDMVHSVEMMGMEQANSKIREEENDGTEFFCVGYSIVKYYLGNVNLTNLVGHRASRISADVIATFLPKDVIDGLYSVCEKAKLNVLNLTLEPIAAINIAIPEKFRLLNLALVDIGAGTSDICITKEGSIIGYGMLPCAGDFFTESIMYEYMTDFATAEKIKLAASTKKKRIAFTDVMGTRQSLETSIVREMLKKPFGKLASMISEKITELNGGEKVGAVFIVGGGGKNPEFTGILAESLGLPPQRVALRGSEVFTGVITPDQKPVKDPMLVTPIGICLNYYDQNNNFIMVQMNGTDIKLYNNGKLNVMDAIITMGYSDRDVFAKRGKELVFTFNGIEKSVKGKMGDSAVIMINGEEGSVSTPLNANDSITMKVSTEGLAGQCKIKDLSEYKEEIFFIINGKKTGFPRMCSANGTKVNPDYSIQQNDQIKLHDFYYLGDLMEIFDISDGFKVVINNKSFDLNNYDPKEKVLENYIVDIVREQKDSLKKQFFREDKKLSEDDEQKEINESTDSGNDPEPEPVKEEKPAVKEITVTVNGDTVRLTGKTGYTFVNVLDFYPFNTSTLKGSRLVCKRNHMEADFFTPVFNGDVLELYWAND